MKILWSWQSDTLRRTGRFFVRDCLLAAVKKLKEAQDVAEPTERDARDAMHVDSDRLGVSGSPDLANLIFQKIDAAQVVVADVTPVSRIAAKTLADGSRTRAKRIMNPNVAIELGYALKSRGSEKVLMVMNEHHGKREHLPFDLAHKAGPLLYKLMDEASKTEIDAAMDALTAQFVIALRPYIQTAADAAVPLRQEIPSTFAPFAYFERGASLAEVDEGDDEVVQYGYFDHRGFYLRVISGRGPSLPFGRVALRDLLSTAGIGGLDRQTGGFFRETLLER